MALKDSGIRSGIAVIGMSCRVPGASNIDEFWRNLCAGRESIRPLSDDELLAAGLDPEDLANPRLVRAGALVDGFDEFDAAFFGITAREAEVMDPQHRLFLESAVHALEHAGYDPERYDGAIGVFGGGIFGSYAARNLVGAGVFEEKHAVLSTILANEKDYMTTRVSYKLNLRGPSYTIQSGCSTSLVAIHLACQNLLNYESDIALAGGVAIDAGRWRGYYHHEGGVMSPDGHCRVFDENARGTVFGNGVGIVVLKRLEDALTDGDTIYAVVLGSATNNDGSLKVGFTAPSVTGQSKVIVEALAAAGATADTIGYIEAHGTGTTLGDPIEVEAMTRAFGGSTTRRQFCAIGSVKSNIGHLDAAAGVSGFIKTVLALGHGLVPPSINFERPNPTIRFEQTPFYVNRTLATWKSGTAPGVPRRAGVSAFGMGGTNVHVVLQEPPEQPPTDLSRPWQLIVLSAKSGDALEEATANLGAHLDAHRDLDLADVAYTLQVGRSAFSHRRAVVCRDIASAVDSLRGDRARVHTREHRGEPCDVAFLFPGQGSQYVGMAGDLYETEPAFRKQIDVCCEVLQPELGLDLRTLLFPPPSNPVQRRAAADRLQRTEFAQPAIFIVEYALALLWADLGIEPSACLGHSLGEYVAACLAGVFTLDDALKIVAARGRLMQQLPPGAMTAVSLPAAEVESLIDGSVSIAATNGRRVTVVSGPTADIERLERQLAGRVDCQRLQTSHAFHSAMMDPILDRFADLVANAVLRMPSTPYITNVTGTWVRPTDAIDPAYWARHLREPVRFAEGVAALVSRGPLHFVEVGPGRTLGSLARTICPDRLVVSSLPAPTESQAASVRMLEALGTLWQHGAAVNWSALYRDEHRRRVALPGYPFERRRYWIEPEKPRPEPAPPVEAPPLVKHDDVSRWCYLPEWRQTPPPRFYAQGQAVAADATWLLFADDGPLSERVRAELVPYVDAARLVTVKPGDGFERTGPDSYTVAPGVARDYASLYSALAETTGLPDIVVHLWTASTVGDMVDAASCEQAQYLGFHSIVALMQAIASHRVNGAVHPVAIKVVTRNVQGVTGFERLRPEHATLLGPGVVIGHEHPEVRCSVIDIEDDDQVQRTRNPVGRLVEELRTLAPEPLVAHRGGARWTQLFEAIALGQDGSPQCPLRPRGVYLILGGLGAVGSALARHLARSVQARLVLVNRSPLPPREEWERFLALHGPLHSTSARIRTVRALEAAGAEVLVVVADVADREQMAAVVSQTCERFGTLNGVICAAGIAGAGSIQGRARSSEQVLMPVSSLQAPDAEAQFRPRMRGLFVLEDVLGARPLDFCLIVSSLSAILGGPGYAAYAGASLFMDAFVRRHNQAHPVPWLTVNWDAWSFGAASSTALSRMTITEEEGAEVFDRVIGAHALGHLVISTVDLYARARRDAAPEAPAESAADAKKRTPAADRRLYARPTSLPSTFESPASDIERTVAAVWQEVLGIDPIGRHDNFFELGGHSLLAVQVAARLEDALQLEIPMRNVFDAPSVADLAARIQLALPARQASAALVGHDFPDCEEFEV
jgi:acyl transferase domain-containing protein/acyl carrier protein